MTTDHVCFWHDCVGQGRQLYQRFLQDFKTCRSRFPRRGNSLPQTQRKWAGWCTSLLCWSSLQKRENSLPHVQHTCQTPVQQARFLPSVSMKHGLGGMWISSAMSLSIQRNSSKISILQNSPVSGGNMLCIQRSNRWSPSNKWIKSKFSGSSFPHNAFGWTLLQKPAWMRFQGLVWSVKPNLNHGKSTTLKIYNIVSKR